MDAHRIAFIGGGNMARSLIGGLIADGFAAERIWVTDPAKERLSALAADYGVHITTDNLEAARATDTWVLAVKPQVMRTVAEGLKAQVAASNPLVISIAAGIREPDLNRWLGGEAAVVRTMPNTPALVQSGATALYANTRVSRERRDFAESLLRAAGITQWLEDEALMDAVTAVSGSGPAYFFRLMELLQASAEQLGLPPATARLLTLQTAFGAAKMALESQDEPGVLRERVTSPGGTTERALQVFEQGDWRGLVQKAVSAAAERAGELGDMLGEQ